MIILDQQKLVFYNEIFGQIRKQAKKIAIMLIFKTFFDQKAPYREKALSGLKNKHSSRTNSLN